jgi:hypothetical protein
MGTEAVVKTILEEAEADFSTRVPRWSFTDLAAPLMLVPDYAYMVAAATLYGIYMGIKRLGIRSLV